MKGQTLIEVLVALGIIAVVATALSAVVVTSMGNARFSQDQNMATQYSQEGLEIMRQIRDNDYVAFRNLNNGNYCLAKGSGALAPDCFSANVDNFLRKVTIAQSGCGVNVASVVVTVSWQSSRCSSANSFCHNAKLSTCLSSVNPVQPL
jgi:prepilin-type N-terminal cleavage/methylation domain-containing protein